MIFPALVRPVGAGGSPEALSMLIGMDVLFEKDVPIEKDVLFEKVMLLEKNMAKWQKVIQQAGITAE
jgi:hypothetical protein